MPLNSMQLTMRELYEIDRLFHAKFFSYSDPFAYLGKGLSPWLEQVLDALEVSKDGQKLLGIVEPGAVIKGRVYLAPGAIIESSAYVSGPCVIGPGSEVRHAAYIRGNVFVGKDCVVGHTTEVKGSLFLDGAKAGHFAYVGDSILGRNCNLGAGTKLANLKFTGNEIRYSWPSGSKSRHSSGLRKFGALIGDEAQTGCNSVLDPGSILLPKSFVLPCSHHRGTA